MKFRTILAACCFSLGIWHTAVSAAPALQEKIAATIEGHQAVVGIVIENTDATDTVAIAGAWWDASNVDEMVANNLVYEG